MAYTLVNSVSAVPGANGGATGSIDTTGADLIVVTITDGNGSIGTLSDSKGNTWTPRTTYNDTAEGTRRAKIYYCPNPTVGTGHTFTYSGTSIYPTIVVTAWSGAHATPYDVENGAGTGGSTSIQPGSVTPSENDELIISCVTANGGTSFSVNSSFTAITHDHGGGNNYGGGQGYLVQTTAAAVNPTWSWTTSGQSAAAIATFKKAAAGGATLHNLTLLGCGA